MSETFYTDIVLEEADIRNLENDLKKILSLVESGNRIIFTGRRNTGKTSLIKSKVIPAYQRKHKNSLVLFVDLMGVKSLEHISHIFITSFEKAFAQVKPAKNFLQQITKIITRTRPTFSVDPLTNEMTFSLAIEEEKSSQTFQDILKVVSQFHKEYGALIVIDEFQDIAIIPQAEARMREALQNLPGNLPVIVLGSKQHLLTEIFARPKAPFANWGKYIEISKITAKEFTPYINTRLKSSKLSMTEQLTQFLLDLVQDIPECVNMVCDYMKELDISKITEDIIKKSVVGVIEERSSMYTRLLSFYTEKEQIFLRELSKAQPLATPYATFFLSRIKMSTGASRPLIKRLENDGIILRDQKGYQVSDPLLTEYLKRN